MVHKEIEKILEVMEKVPKIEYMPCCSLAFHMSHACLALHMHALHVHRRLALHMHALPTVALHCLHGLHTLYKEPQKTEVEDFFARRSQRSSIRRRL